MTRRLRTIKFEEAAAFVENGSFGPLGWEALPEQPIRLQTAQATATKIAARKAHILRARGLDRLGTMTRVAMGKLMAKEDGRPETPYHERTIRRWLREDPDKP